MMLRILFLFLAAGGLAVHASDAIEAPMAGASASVSQPHVVAELIPERTTIEPGKPFDVALHLHMDADWHTYWINPGDAGLATTIAWTLPPGFTAGPIQWPTPEKHNMGPLVTYGYGGDVYLLTTITPPKGDLPQHFDVKAHAEWLVCKEECIPGRGDFTLPLDSGLLNLRLPVENTDFFAQARERMPVANTIWNVTASYRPSKGVPPDPKLGPVPQTLWLQFSDRSGAPTKIPDGAVFFPEQTNVLSTVAADASRPDSSTFAIVLQVNGDTPNKLSGVLVSDEPLIGETKAIYLAEFPVSAAPAADSSDGHRPPLQLNGAGSTFSLQPSSSTAGATAPAAEPAAATSEASSSSPVARSATVTTDAPPLLIAVLGAAFVGGLILNLMPCVLPVLSLKVFSLMKHSGDPKRAWVQGVAFTAGVVVSFWVLAGLLLALRSAGNQLGWGFQMQNPMFVLGLILLFFLLALNLFGVFELGTSLVGLDAKAAGQLGGLASSFGNGALATLAATPCTAPFMGSALGFAAQQSAAISLLIFTFLALGMAAPYLLLTIFPGALRFVPKPGAWMEAFKQFMGFLLMATVIYLVYVFGALAGSDAVPALLFVLLLAGLAAWIYGKWGTPVRSGPVRAVAILLTLAFLVGAIWWGVALAGTGARSATATAEASSDGWQPWSQAAVDATLAKGQPVFVDFTAAWCLSCKVNERVALGTDAVKKAFADKNVALFKADWTHSDPEISRTLQKFNRDGVPLYLLYSPKSPATPQVLPEVLTPGIVLGAVQGL